MRKRLMRGSPREPGPFKPRGSGLNAQKLYKKMNRKARRNDWGVRVPVTVEVPAWLVRNDPEPNPLPIRPGWEPYLISSGCPPEPHELARQPWLESEQHPGDWHTGGWFKELPSFPDEKYRSESARMTEEELRAFVRHGEWTNRIVYGALEGWGEYDREWERLSEAYHPVIQKMWSEFGSKVAGAAQQGDKLVFWFSCKKVYTNYEAVWIRQLLRVAAQYEVPIKVKIG